MLKFNALGWRKEDETSPNKILLKRHYGVDGFFSVFGLTKPLWEKVILCNDASLGEVFNFSVFYGFFGCYDGLLIPPSYGA